MGFLDFLKLIIRLTGSNIIAGTQVAVLPSSDFMSMQLLSSDTASLPVTREVQAVTAGVVDMKSRAYVADNIQIDSYSNGLDSARKQLADFIAGIRTAHREPLNEAGYQTVTISDMKNLSEYVGGTYHYRWSATISISYVVQNTWQEIQMQDVEATAE